MSLKVNTTWVAPITFRMERTKRGVPKGASIGDLRPAVLRNRIVWYVVGAVLGAAGVWVSAFLLIGDKGLDDRAAGAFTVTSYVAVAAGAVVAFSTFLRSVRLRFYQELVGVWRNIASAWNELQWWTGKSHAARANQKLARAWLDVEKQRFIQLRDDFRCDGQHAEWHGLLPKWKRSCPLRIKPGHGACPVRLDDAWELALKHHREALDKCRSKACSLRHPETVRVLECNQRTAEKLNQSINVLDHLEERLRRTTLISRPTGPDELILWLEKHDHELTMLNDSLLDELPAEFRIEHRSPDFPELVQAFIQWQYAINSAKGELVPWPSMVGITERIDYLARYWWTLASEDPLYRNPDLDAREERKRAFDQLREAIREFEQTMQFQDLGATRFQQVLIKLVLGPKVIQSFDRMNRQI